MGTWNTRGLRGSTLEELINLTIEKYKDNEIALIQKIPTPIKPIKIDQTSRHITLAYFEQKSTVDYIGVVQGIPICFDAKECNTDTFPLQNIHEHQVMFMEQFEKQDGISFIIIHYTHKDEMYYIPFSYIKEFFERSNNGGRKSFKFEEIDHTYKIKSKNGVPVHFLEQLQCDINSRCWQKYIFSIE